MSRKPVIDGWQGASYEDIDFSRWVTGWKDTRATGVMTHQFLKRSGGMGEDMGRPPHETKITLSFIGKPGITAYLELQAKIDAKPIGRLVHPIFGNMNASCMGTADAGTDIANASNLYDVPLRFIESNLDVSVQSEQRAPALAADVAAANTILSDAMTRFLQASAIAEALISAATAFAAAALGSAEEVIADTSLDQLLEAVRTEAETTLAALDIDTSILGATDATRYEATVAVEQVYSACVQLSEAVSEHRPTKQVYVLPSRMHINLLASVFYGSDALAMVDVILADNPRRIPDPGAIPQGTRLVMTTPTIDQD